MALERNTLKDGVCKLRPAEGIQSIYQLDPGMVTGPLSAVWQVFRTNSEADTQVSCPPVHNHCTLILTEP